MANSNTANTIRFFSLRWAFLAWALAGAYYATAGGDFREPAHFHFQKDLADACVWLLCFLGIGVSIMASFVSTLRRVAEEQDPVLWIPACIELTLLVLSTIWFFLIGSEQGQVAALLDGRNPKKSIMCSLKLPDRSSVIYKCIETPPMTSNEFLLVRRQRLAFGLEKEQLIFRNQGYAESSLSLAGNRLILKRKGTETRFALNKILDL